MKYFLAEELETKPFIRWHKWADSIEELTEMGEFENPLIVIEDSLPAYQFRVCPLKIVGGELVERDGAEMAAYEAEYELYLKQVTEAAKIKDFTAARFTFDDHTYPMNEAARLRYMAAAMLTPIGTTRFMDYLGEVVVIDETDSPNFFDAYCKKILAMTDPDKPLIP